MVIVPGIPVFGGGGGIDQGGLVVGKSLGAYPAHDGPRLVVCHQCVSIVGEEMADLGA